MRYRQARILIKYLPITLVLFFSVFLCSVSWPADNSQERPSQRRSKYKKKYNFTTDWFTQHIPVWSRVLAEYKNKPNIHYLEIGVFEGRATIWMLENILTHPTAKVTGIDIFPKNLQLRFSRNVQQSGFAEKVTTIKGGSQITLRDFPPNSFDIIYIDGDHSAPAVLTDAVLCWMLLKKNGILIFDDYNYKLKERPPEKRPKISVDAFISGYRTYIDTLDVGKQFIIRKKERIDWESY